MLKCFFFENILELVQVEFFINHPRSRHELAKVVVCKYFCMYYLFVSRKIARTISHNPATPCCIFFVLEV